MSNPNPSIVYVITDLWPFPEKTKEARKILCEMVPEAKKNKTCLKYELAENLSDRAQLTLFQAWSTEEALEAHLKSEIINKATDSLREFLEKPTEIRRYKNIG